MASTVDSHLQCHCRFYFSHMYMHRLCAFLVGEVKREKLPQFFVDSSLYIASAYRFSIYTIMAATHQVTGTLYYLVIYKGKLVKSYDFFPFSVLSLPCLHDFFCSTFVGQMYLYLIHVDITSNTTEGGCPRIIGYSSVNSVLIEICGNSISWYIGETMHSYVPVHKVVQLWLRDFFSVADSIEVLSSQEAANFKRGEKKGYPNGLRKSVEEVIMI